MIEKILFLIIGLFFLILIFREFLPKKTKEGICSICLAFSLTWIILLVLFYQGLFNNLLLIGIMIGMTLLGIFYTFEKKARKELLVFRLPFILTLLLIGYYILTLENLIQEGVIALVVWILFGLIYFYRSNGKVGKVMKKIVECCKNW